MASQLLESTWNLVRFTVRRDRIRIPIWVVSISFITILIAGTFTNMYKSEQERQAIAETMRNPAMTAMVGPGYGLDNYTEGAMMSHQMLLFTAIVVAIMSILLVTRHTRAVEEDGQSELIQSLPVGRLSSLTATVIVTVLANMLLAITTGIGLYLLGIESMDLQGSLLYGSALGATGLFFIAITALFAQLSENSRGTIGLSFAVLIVAYLIRAIGDVSNPSVSWLSPLGWILGTEVYVNNYWWPIILTILLSTFITIIALYLHAKRDLGSGLLPTKPGRKHASMFLCTPFGLSVRLQRTGMIAWAIGMLLLGVSYGSVLGDLEEFFAQIEMLEDLLSPVSGYSLTEQFLTLLMVVISMICTIPALMMILKLKGEEKKNRTEHLVARAVSRTRIIGSYITISVIGGFLMLFLSVFGLWAAGSQVMEETISFTIMFQAAMVYLPAMWIMVSLAVLFIGIYPKLSGLCYLYLGYSFFVVYLGSLLQFPDWMGKLSPFGHVPQVPVEEVNYVKLTILTIVALTVTVVGVIGYNKRDLEG